MADEDKEKAEKVAAAKKRYEQLKKQKQKEGKKGGAKKSDDKTAAESKTDEIVDAAEPATTDNDKAVEVDGDDAETSKQDGTASLPQHSEERSDSFRHANPQGEVQELYRKQAVRIEELEKENRAFKEQQEESATRLAKTEEELESLREGSSETAALKSKAKDADKLSAELEYVQRQLVQAQQAAKGSNRRVSGTSPDLSEQLASKTSTIEDLELEVSNLRHQATTLTGTVSERDDAIKDAEERANAAEAATQAAKQELDALKVSIAFPSDETKAANEDPDALTKRITVLESDVRTAKSDLEAASQRAGTLQQKLEAITKLHRDAVTASQSKDKEVSALRTQLKRRDRPSHVRDASEFDLQDDETETGQLQARIRALEAENFDLRRGIWREKRAELQPGMGEHEGTLEYEDVDLSSPHSPRSSSLTRPAHSTFQDVINSGISAFTGRARDQQGTSSSAAMRPRKQSLGLLSEDGFDEEAFLLAQEEEGKRRIERVKEVKRGLNQWEGWRMDLVDLRQGGIGGGREVGPVFEV